MRLLTRTAALALIFFAATGPANAWTRGSATTFATLPVGSAHPEGLTVDAAGNVWIADFDVTKSSGPGQVLEFDPSGTLLRVLNVKGSSNLLLGLAFHPTTGELLVIDFGGKVVLRVNPISGTSKVFMTVTGNAGLNGLTFDAAGNVYVSDSFQGIIWKTGLHGGAGTVWKSDPLLTTTGVPPFGANGIAFNNEGTALFVANTGNDTVVTIPVNPDGTAGTPAVFVNSINGADGLIIDRNDNVWVCANQADEIVVVDPTGRAIAKLGDFNGIASGAPRGLLFPASLGFSPDGTVVYVTNLSLDLRLFNPAFNAVDSQWAAQVTTHTVAKIPVPTSFPALP